MREKNLVFHQCPHCKFSTKYSWALIQHKRTHEEKILHKCKFCDYVSLKNHEVIRHMRTHTGERPFACGQLGCNYAAKSCADLIRHRRCVHLKLKTHSCHLCDYRTEQKYHLSRHMLTHEENAAKLKFCELCPYKTVLAENLRRHKITVHSTSRLFKCPHPNCDYAGKFEPALKTHLLGHLPDNSWKPLKCSWPGCKYRGKIPAHIRKHMTVHTKEKPFKCTLCPKAYTAHVALVSHMCSHTKEVHHPCKLCDYGTSWPKELNKHYAAYHSSTRIVKCIIDSCSFTADTDRGLSLHLSIKHSIRGRNYMLKYRVNAREKGKEQRKKKKLIEERDQNMAVKCRVPRCPIITLDGASMASHLYTVHDLPRICLDRIGLNVEKLQE